MNLAHIFGIREHEPYLLLELQQAHYIAAMQNQNASSKVAELTYTASGDLVKAITAAAMSQGGLHAPIAQARALLAHPRPQVVAHDMRLNGRRIPGFGNSFYKKDIDPAFKFLYTELPQVYRTKIGEINLEVPKLFPNAAMITAAVLLVSNLPCGVESLIFTYSRIPAWTKRCLALKAQLPTL